MAKKDMKSCDCGCENCNCGENCNCNDKKMMWNNGKRWKGGGRGFGGLWFAGFIGALFYFLQNVVGLGPVLIGIIKALLWPSFVIFKILELLKV